MEDTLQTDAHVDYYYSLVPAQFSYLRRLEFSQSEAGQTLTIEMEHDTEPSQLVLVFTGVTGLEFLPHGFQPVPLLLEIGYIGSRQWQNLHYQVSNMEQDVRLRFYCRNFHAALQDCDVIEQPIM